MENKTAITVQTTVNAPISKVWDSWTKPEHIIHWYHASPDWHAPYAASNLYKDGKFKITMAAIDGSMGFDLEGTYTNVIENELIEYTLADDRKVKISFEENNGATIVTEVFEAESTNPIEMQQGGWQAIFDNFKKHTEAY